MIRSRLAGDMAALRDRREVLLGAAASASVFAASGPVMAARATKCILTPSETRGPFPADGTRGPDALSQSGIERSDIRGSFGGMTGTAAGVPLDLAITLIGAAGVCQPLPGWGVHLWHNDARGRYSLYALPRANYLRGLQQSGEDGIVRFKTILPGCYGGRCPHMHFEVFSSAEAAVSGEPAMLASQFALPEDACRAVYAGDMHPVDPAL